MSTRTANAFHLASIVGVFDGQVQITIRGGRREIKECSRLIRAFKTHLHKTAKLMPRVSDPDFKEGRLQYWRAWEAPVTDSQDC